jgi:hypothetical protein
MADLPPKVRHQGFEQYQGPICYNDADDALLLLSRKRSLLREEYAHVGKVRHLRHVRHCMAPSDRAAP